MKVPTILQCAIAGAVGALIVGALEFAIDVVMEARDNERRREVIHSMAKAMPGMYKAAMGGSDASTTPVPSNDAGSVHGVSVDQDGERLF